VLAQLLPLALGHLPRRRRSPAAPDAPQASPHAPRLDQAHVGGDLADPSLLGGRRVERRQPFHAEHDVVTRFCAEARERPFLATEWHCFVRVSRKRYESLCSSRVGLPTVRSMALLLPPAPLRCNRCATAAAELYGVTFARGGASAGWENGFHSANGLLFRRRDTPARIVELLRSHGLVPSACLVEILSAYGYRVEPAGGDVALPG